MQVCHFGFALSFLLSFLCHFIVLWEMQNKCIEKNSQSANCKTPSTKRNREKCRPLKFGAPHFDGFLKSSRKCYIYNYISIYLCPWLWGSFHIFPVHILRNAQGPGSGHCLQSLRIIEPAHPIETRLQNARQSWPCHAMPQTWGARGAARNGA